MYGESYVRSANTLLNAIANNGTELLNPEV